MENKTNRFSLDIDNLKSKIEESKLTKEAKKATKNLCNQIVLNLKLINKRLGEKK